MFAAIILLLTAILFRVLPPLLHVQHDWINNFSPVASLVLCGSLFFPRKMAWGLPLALLAVSDWVLNRFVYHAPIFSWEILPRYAAFLIIALWGFYVGAKMIKKPAPILAAALASSLFFYLLTNTASWLGDPGYGKGLAGWVQSLTVGLPGFPPTWLFLRNSIVSDLLFTGLFLICMSFGHEKEEAVSALDLARAK